MNWIRNGCIETLSIDERSLDASSPRDVAQVAGKCLTSYRRPR
jgi:hypothetical protein